MFANYYQRGEAKNMSKITYKLVRESTQEVVYAANSKDTIYGFHDKYFYNDGEIYELVKEEILSTTISRLGKKN